MTQEFLSGLVTVDRLTSTPDAKGRFFGGDDRGHVAMVVRDGSCRSVEVAEFASVGVIRGKHFHQHLMERLTVISGSVEFGFRPANEPSEMTWIVLEKGDMATIQPHVAHIFRAREPAVIVSIAEGADAFEDRVSILP